jgi:hypothetical protein
MVVLAACSEWCASFSSNYVRSLADVESGTVRSVQITSVKAPTSGFRVPRQAMVTEEELEVMVTLSRVGLGRG